MILSNKDEVIIRGTNADFDGYPTTAQLELLSGYKFFDGFYVSSKPETNTNSEVKKYPSGRSNSQSNYFKIYTISTIWQSIGIYNNDSILIDNSSNKLQELLNCKYHWIQRKSGDFYFVPSTVVDYTTKHAPVGITYQEEFSSNLFKITLNCEGEIG